MKTFYHRLLSILVFLSEKCGYTYKPEIDYTIQFSLHFRNEGIKITGENLMLKIKPGQQAEVKLIAKDRFGNEVEIDSAEWSVDNDLVTLETIGDSETARTLKVSKTIGRGRPLTGFVTVVADADLDEDETREITGVLPFVIEAEAEVIELDASEPEDTPEETENGGGETEGGEDTTSGESETGSETSGGENAVVNGDETTPENSQL